MAKVSRKPSEPKTETDQPTSSSKQGKMKKVPGQPKSENGGKALKKATKVKRSLQRTLSKKVSEKATNSIRKSKKTRPSTRFGHYHRLNETLRQNDPEQNHEEVQKPRSGRKDLGSQGTSERNRGPQKHP